MDIPIITPADHAPNGATQTARNLPAFDKQASFLGETLNELNKTLKKMNAGTSKMPSGDHSASTSAPTSSGTAASAAKVKSEGVAAQNMKEFAGSLKEASTSLASSILGDTSFLTKPFKQFADITKKGFGFLTGKGKNRVRPKREELLKHGAEGAGSVFIVDWLKRLLGKGGGKKAEGGGSFLSNLLGGTALGAMATKLFPALAKVLPWAALAGGILWGVMDAIAAIGLKEKWGVTTVEAAIGGFFGGTGKGWENVLPNVGKGALIGAGIGGIAGGPLGALAGLLIGGVIGGILGFIGGEQIANTVSDWMDTDGLLTKIGLVGGAVIGMIFGPAGMVIGGLIGAALGLTAEVLNEQLSDDINKRTIKQQLYDILIKPIVGFFQGIGSMFEMLGAIWGQEGLAPRKKIADVLKYLTGIGGASSGARLRTVESRLATTKEIERVTQELAATPGQADLQAKRDEAKALFDYWQSDLSNPKSIASLYAKQAAYAEGSKEWNLIESEVAGVGAQDRNPARQALYAAEAALKVGGSDEKRQELIDELAELNSSLLEINKEKIAIEFDADMRAKFKQKYEESGAAVGPWQKIQEGLFSVGNFLSETFLGSTPFAQYKSRGDIMDRVIKEILEEAGYTGAITDYEFQRPREYSKEDDAIITSDGKVISLHPNDNILATQNDVEIMSDVNATSKLMKGSAMEQLGAMFERALAKNGGAGGAPVLQTNIIGRYSAENIMAVGGAATP